MTKLKNKAILRIAVFAIIMTMLLWLMPAGIISAEGNSSFAELQAAADLANTVLTDAQAAADAASASLATGQADLDDANVNLANAQSGGVIEEIALAQASVDSAVLALSTAQETADSASAALEAAQAVADAANSALAAAQSGETAPPDPNLGQDGGESDINPDQTPIVLNPELDTDKEDYSPEETVIITGTGFAPNAIYTIVVTRPDGSVVIGDGSFTPGSDKVLTDDSGNFTYNYILDGIMGVYKIVAVDASGSIVATKTFRDCNLFINITKYWEKNGTPGKQEDEPIISQTATFTLYKQGDPNPKTTADTNSSGVAQFHITGDLWGEGIYKIVETVAPSGFTGGYDSGWFSVNSGNDVGTWYYYAPNTEIKGSIEVTKRGMMPGELVSISLYKNGVLIETKPAGGDGVYIFSDLVLGDDYSITEAYASGNLYSYAEALQTPSNPIDVSSSTAVTVTLVNNPEKGSISIHKTGLEDGDTAVFSLIGPGGPYADITVAKGGTKGWTDLPYGSYTITESWSNGNTWVYNTDLSSGPVVIGTANQDPTINVTNTARKGSIELFKTDQVSGLALGGSTFHLWHLPDLTLIGDVVLGADGHYKWDNLPYGHYLVVEALAPAGYLIRDPVDVYIDPAGTLDHILRLEIADPRIPGRIKITKVDDDGVAVSGIGFTLYNSGKTAVIRAEKKTDAAGKLLFDNLDWGTYTLSETDSLGYDAADDVKITISASNTEAGKEVTVVNSSTTPPEITVAGLTEGIQVLAFTGIDPIIPISGGSSIAVGAAMLIATIMRRNKRSAKNVSQKEG